MVDGVNLITTETICISGSFIGNLIPAIITAIGCIALIVLLVFCIKDKEMPTFLLGLVMLTLLGILSFICFNDAFNPRYEERYLVQLDDKISSEFIDKYEIVERKGNNVYVIRESDADD